MRAFADHNEFGYWQFGYRFQIKMCAVQNRKKRHCRIGRITLKAAG